MWGLLFAQDKGPGYLSNSTEAQRIEDLLSFYGLTKWGFVVYRCTYGDDERWAQFMARLNTHRDAVLRAFYHKPELVESYDWNVHEDPSLEGATKDEVRRRFRQWVTTTSQMEIPGGLEDFKKAAIMRENPRYNYCVHVDLDAMDSVMQQPAGAIGLDCPVSGYVNLVRADRGWDLPDFDRFDWASHESLKAAEAEKQERNEEEDGDEYEDEEEYEDEDEYEDEYDKGEPEIEGSRLTDVGWLMVCAGSLVPETFAALIRSFVWDIKYRRPPKVMEL